MIIEIALYFIAYYIFIGISYYSYGVLKAWEFTGVWRFFIKDGTIAGICKYPKWTLFWLEWIVKKLERG